MIEMISLLPLINIESSELDKMIIGQSVQQPKRKTGNQGFSLVELMIVMTLLLVMGSIAIPNYLAALARANEASASSSVRAIVSAENLYRNTYGTFTVLQDLGSEYLTDSLLGSGAKSGYRFNVTPGTGNSSGLQFSVDATPALSIGPSASGIRHYYGDESAVVRFSMTGAADATSPPI
jgi:type IV pilus assembly protein PilA